MSQKQVLQGIGVGSRAVRAEVFRLTARRALPAPLKSALTPAEEAQTLSQAISSLEETYAEKIASASGNLKEILEAQLALATDSELFESAVQHCEGGWNASTAIQMAMNEFRELLSGADGEFGERVADLDEIACFAHDLALAGLQLGGDRVGDALRVIDREIGEFHGEHERVFRVVARRDFDVGDVVEAHLAFFHGTAVEDLGRDGLWREFDALLLRLVQHGGKKTHLKFKRQHIHPRGPALAAFGDDFLDKQPPHG